MRDNWYVSSERGAQLVFEFVLYAMKKSRYCRHLYNHFTSHFPPFINFNLLMSFVELQR